MSTQLADLSKARNIKALTNHTRTGIAFALATFGSSSILTELSAA